MLINKGTAAFHESSVQGKAKLYMWICERRRQRACKVKLEAWSRGSSRGEKKRDLATGLDIVHVLRRDDMVALTDQLSPVKSHLVRHAKQFLRAYDWGSWQQKKDRTYFRFKRRLLQSGFRTVSIYMHNLWMHRALFCSSSRKMSTWVDVVVFNYYFGSLLNYKEQ